MRVADRICVWLMPILLTGLVGCGPSGPEIASVEGTVTMDGKPLPNATVVFTPMNGSGRPAGAMTDENGFYELNFSGGRQGAMLGENRVSITTLSDPYEDADGNPVPGTPETVPVQYNSETELKFTVEEGKENVANFDLSSEGRIADDDTGYGDEG